MTVKKNSNCLGRLAWLTAGLFMLGISLGWILPLFNAFVFNGIYGEGNCTITHTTLHETCYVSSCEYSGYVKIQYNGLVTNLTRNTRIFWGVKNKTEAENAMQEMKKKYVVNDKIACYYPLESYIVKMYIKPEIDIQLYMIVIPIILSMILLPFLFGYFVYVQNKEVTSMKEAGKKIK